MSTASADLHPEAGGRKRRLRLAFPHTYAVIMGMLALAALATWIVPAGLYDTTKVDVNGTARTLVVDGSYHHVAQAPVSLFEMFTSIPVGLAKGAEIVFYIFLVAGTFAVIQRTGAIEGLVGVIIRKFSKIDIVLIPLLMLVFSILGFTIGMAEEAIIFVPIVIPIMRSFKYDALTGAAIVLLGAGTGFMGGMFNPFTVGIAQGISQVTLFSGWQFRVGVWLVFLLSAIAWVIRHAHRVRRDPSSSPVADLEAEVAREHEDGGGYRIVDLTWRHGVIMLGLLAAILTNVYGIFNFGWFLQEMCGTFLILMVFAGLVGGLGVNDTFDAFVDGMRDIASGALIVGFARAILVVLEQGQIIHTILHWLADVIGSAPHQLVAILMLVFQMFMNVVIPSGSGQAAATMPVMAPLSDLLGIQRQVAVLAFQYGDGISNTIIPTSGPLLATLAVARIPYEKWVKWVLPFVGITFLISAVALFVAVAVGLH